MKKLHHILQATMLLTIGITISCGTYISTSNSIGTVSIHLDKTCDGIGGVSQQGGELFETTLSAVPHGSQLSLFGKKYICQRGICRYKI